MRRLRPGKIFGFGAREHGALGNGVIASTIDILNPSLVEFSKDKCVLDVSASWGHSTFTVKEGDRYEVYAAGRTHDLTNTISFNRYSSLFPGITNIWLKLGFGNSVDFPEPTKIAEFTGIQPKVISGAARVFVLHEGTALSFGFNRYGQCGIVSKRNYVWELTEPIYEESPNIIDVSCGLQHTHFLTSLGEVYSCGKGKTGQLGLESILNNDLSSVGNIGEIFFVPEKIPIKDFNGQKITKVCSGTQTSACLTESGKIYVFGQYSSTELNEEETKYQDQFTPRELTHFSSIENRVVDLYSTSHSYLAVTSSGETYMWGTIPQAIDISVLRSKIKYSNPDYEFTVGDKLLDTDKPLSRILQNPVKVNIFLEKGDKIFPGFHGYYILRKDGHSLSYLDWNLSLDYLSINLDETPKIVKMVNGWRHGFFVTE